MTIITGETIEQYHDHTATSSSKLTAFIERGPYYFAGRFITKTVPAPKPTEALEDGNAFDCLMTEGHRPYAARYVVKPKGLSLSTTEGKGWLRLWGLNVENPSRKIIAAEKHEAFLAMRESILEHPLARQIVEARDLLTQATFRIDSETYHQSLQVRPDFASPTPIDISDGLAWSANLKTTADMSDWWDIDDPSGPRSCAPIYGWNYHRQAALDQYVLFQHEQFKRTAHFLIVVEKQAPYRCAVVQMTDDYLELGFQVVRTNLLRIAACYRSGCWPKSPSLLIRAEPPQWLLDKGVRQAVTAAEMVGSEAQ